MKRLLAFSLGLALGIAMAVGWHVFATPPTSAPPPIVASSSSSATPTALPSATPTATPTATSTPMATPTPIPAATPTAVSTPTVSPTDPACPPGTHWSPGYPCQETATPAPASAPVDWSAAECAWAVTTLQQDAAMDTAEADALAAGTDTRYPTSDIAVYQESAAEWTAIAGWITASCASRVAPPAADVAEALQWLEAGYQSHVTDAAVNPQDAAWDTQWEETYQTLELMLEPDCADGAACAGIS